MSDTRTVEISLHHHLSSVLPSLKASSIHTIIKAFKSIELPKGSFLVKSGEICSLVAFIEKGVVRNYQYNSKGNEITTYLVDEGNFNTSYASFFQQTSSTESIVAVSDCRLAVLDFPRFALLKNTSKVFSEIVDTLVVKGLQCKDERLTAYQTQDAKSRYNDLLINQPSIVRHTPIQHIASYLGISRETLSRLRGKKYEAG
ncbi:MAG: Crp/Fnr family transcriptional regulator [Bacteroidota bacterium]